MIKTVFSIDSIFAFILDVALAHWAFCLLLDPLAEAVEMENVLAVQFNDLLTIVRLECLEANDALFLFFSLLLLVVGSVFF